MVNDSQYTAVYLGGFGGGTYAGCRFYLYRHSERNKSPNHCFVDKILFLYYILFERSIDGLYLARYILFTLFLWMLLVSIACN